MNKSKQASVNLFYSKELNQYAITFISGTETTSDVDEMKLYDPQGDYKLVFRANTDSFYQAKRIAEMVFNKSNIANNKIHSSTLPYCCVGLYNTRQTNTEAKQFFINRVCSYSENITHAHTLDIKGVYIYLAYHAEEKLFTFGPNTGSVSKVNESLAEGTRSGWDIIDIYIPKNNSHADNILIALGREFGYLFMDTTRRLDNAYEVISSIHNVMKRFTTTVSNLKNIPIVTGLSGTIDAYFDNRKFVYYKHQMSSCTLSGTPFTIDFDENVSFYYDAPNGDIDTPNCIEHAVEKDVLDSVFKILPDSSDVTVTGVVNGILDRLRDMMKAEENMLLIEI